MAVVDVELQEESQSRYLTYALSVVSARALPDVRDGLKACPAKNFICNGAGFAFAPRGKLIESLQRLSVMC